MSVLWLSLRIAWSAVLRAGFRSLLTIVGVLIGIAAVVMVVSLGESARAQVNERIQGLGSNLIFIFRAREIGAQRGQREGRYLSLGDVEAIRREVSGLRGVSAYVSTRADVQGPFDSAPLEVAGADHEFSSVSGHHIAAGRDLTASDVRTKARVALIGSTAARRVFGAEDPVGRPVRVGRNRFEVVGLLAPKGQSALGGDPDDCLVLPIRTWQTRFNPGTGQRVDSIIASAPTPESVAGYQARIDEVMREAHRIPAEGRPDFGVEAQDAFRQTQEAIFGVLSLVLLAVAGISLFVGGLGVTNILLVSVNERQREIGTRLAVGARPLDIRWQFLAEALTLTLIGGLLGLALAASGITLLEKELGWEIRIDLVAVAVAMGTSSLVGLAAGTLPARRAAKLDPIEALRLG